MQPVPLSQLPTAYVHPINLGNSLGSGLSDPAPLCWMQQEPWLESVINFPFFASCIVLEAFSLPARGFGHRAKHFIWGPWRCAGGWGALVTALRSRPSLSYTSELSNSNSRFWVSDFGKRLQGIPALAKTFPLILDCFCYSFGCSFVHLQDSYSTLIAC